MFDKFSYKQKCYGLFTVFLLFLMLGYRISFSDTVELLTEINDKEKKLIWLKEKEKELPALKIKMAEFGKAYSNNDSSSVRDKLTAYISDFAEKNHCLVTEIPLNSFFKNDRLRVQTNTFTVRGTFPELLSLLYNLEKDFKYASKIMSAKFFIVKDIQTKRKNLYLTLVTQSFKQKV